MDFESSTLGFMAGLFIDNSSASTIQLIFFFLVIPFIVIDFAKKYQGQFSAWLGLLYEW
jgi:hypothetical protein